MGLPWPPTVNGGYWMPVVRKGKKGKRVGQLVLSDKGKDYRARVVAGCKKAFKQISFTGRLCMKTIMYPPDNRTRDLSNYLKSFEDALVHANVIDDDGLIDRIVVDRGPVKPNGQIITTIEEIPPALYADQSTYPIDVALAVISEHAERPAGQLTKTDCAELRQAATDLIKAIDSQNR